ncbi:MAG: hypothetical protein ACK5Q5_14650 [Planctomycetaceae bacterium]
MLSSISHHLRFPARLAGWSCLLMAPSLFAQLPSGDAVIRSPAGESEIVMTTTSRLAGAIHSLTWNGQEFIDSHDHGRQLQSALNCDAGAPIAAETFNPTEAGSRRDGTGSGSTSRLLHLVADHNQIQTTTQMAFWLAPGEASGPHLARNSSLCSNHLVTKRVTIGVDGHPQVLQYDVTFSLPVDERHQHVVFEALTGYMPPEFDTFWRFDREQQTLVPLSDGPGEQADPVVLSTADGRYAMGVIGQSTAVPAIVGPRYGRFRFTREQVVKWNCVYRWQSSNEIPPGDYSFSMRVGVGTRSQVESLVRESRLHNLILPGDMAPGKAGFSR